MAPNFIGSDRVIGSYLAVCFKWFFSKAFRVTQIRDGV